MLYLRGFCIATDPDDNVEIFCEVFRVASEWRKDFNIPHYKSLYEFSYRSCDFFRMKNYNV